MGIETAGRRHPLCVGVDEVLPTGVQPLLNADCKLGTVSTKKGAAHPPKVISQAPAAGKVHVAGTKVHLLLG